jgi:hypothetical protein
VMALAERNSSRKSRSETASILFNMTTCNQISRKKGTNINRMTGTTTWINFKPIKSNIPIPHRSCKSQCI